MGSALASGAAALLLPRPCVPELWFVPVAHGSWTVSLLPESWGGGEEGESRLSLQEDGDGTAEVWLEGLETTSPCLVLESHSE